MTSIAVIAHRSILDHRSGAAIELRSLLEVLAGAGHRCWSLTCSLFHGQQESLERAPVRTWNERASKP
ncbi:MAG: hypothetical protein U5K43_05980 [Halofilum sp. (in: g-proteobacteria)]|nr:hypothetical protein [Halofilum sp. (in: g-proteobacteria)]